MQTGSNHCQTAKQQAENDTPKAELLWFLQKLFDSSSERRTDDVEGQLSLFETEPEEGKPVELIIPEVVSIPKKSREKKPVLAEQFKGIPAKQGMAYFLTEEGKLCLLYGSDMAAIGMEVIRSEVVYTPSRQERIEYIATTYDACYVSESLLF